MSKNNVIRSAICHAIFWLVLGNAVGLLMASLLSWPECGRFISPFNYGRFAPVHLNVQLYGWTSVPLIAWLFYLFDLGKARTTLLAEIALWSWSIALGIGVYSWLMGSSSGKIFLDWNGGALWCFMLAQVILWIALFHAWYRGQAHWTFSGKWSRFAALMFLALVPLSLWISSSPDTYPPVNRSTGGPTGASLLGSSLIVIAMLLVLPRSIGIKGHLWQEKKLWMRWCAEFVAFILLEWRGGSHHSFLQIGGLALLLPWIWLIPRMWRDLTWSSAVLFWKNSMLLWWLILVLLGWLEFLPGVLDRMKFTNGLVAHSHLAMAGFTSAFVIFVSSVIGGERIARQFTSRAWYWHGAVMGYIIAMLICGWLEGVSYEWMSVNPFWRIMLYHVRFACGAVMFVVSIHWYVAMMKGNKRS